MARPLRIEYERAGYHVMNRGAGRRVIFADGDAYQRFLDTLAETVDRFRIEVDAYCLTPNDYHLLLRTPFANLGRAMRHIDGVYTQRHNRVVGTVRIDDLTARRGRTPERSRPFAMWLCRQEAGPSLQ